MSYSNVSDACLRVRCGGVTLRKRYRQPRYFFALQLLTSAVDPIVSPTCISNKTGVSQLNGGTY